MSEAVHASCRAAGALQEWDFDDVYREHFDFVYRIVARLAGAVDAEDLCQDVFVVVHRRLDDFEGRADIKTWLFQIAYRRVGAHIRKRRLRRLLTVGLGAEPGPESSSGMLRELERVEEAERLAAALRKLKWKKRAVLVLHDVEAWPCALIAERLQIPTNTVYTRLHHARKELAEWLHRRDAREGAMR